MSSIITNINQLDLNGTYTYADYLLWRVKERLQLFKGKILKMSPAPTSFHQAILGNLHSEFRKILKKRKCRVYLAPFDVRFPDKDGSVKTVVQPDLCVVCNREQIDKRGCVGAPSLVVEIVSSNSENDTKLKYELYQEEGVPEYWIVFPLDKMIQRYVLENGKYIGLAPIVKGEMISSATFPELQFSTEEIFDVWGLEDDEF